MKEIIERRYYECPYCIEYGENNRSLYEEEEECREHIKECVFNPENKRCATCKHLCLYERITYKGGNPVTSYACRKNGKYGHISSKKMNEERKDCYEEREYPIGYEGEKKLPFVQNKTAREYWIKREEQNKKEREYLEKLKRAEKGFKSNIEIAQRMAQENRLKEEERNIRNTLENKEIEVVETENAYE